MNKNAKILPPIFAEQLKVHNEIDDLLEIDEIDADLAAKLIMAARAHWFEGEEQAAAEAA